MSLARVKPRIFLKCDCPLELKQAFPLIFATLKAKCKCIHYDWITEAVSCQFDESGEDTTLQEDREHSWL